MSWRVLVCGGRDYADAEKVRETLDAIHYGREPFSCLIHGGAAGADSLADEWARANDVPVEEYPADWKTHGRAAGPIRNEEMLRLGRPDVAVVFPGGRGTMDMARRLALAGVPVLAPVERSETAPKDPEVGDVGESVGA